MASIKLTKENINNYVEWKSGNNTTIGQVVKILENGDFQIELPSGATFDIKADHEVSIITEDRYNEIVSTLVKKIESKKSKASKDKEESKMHDELKAQLVESQALANALKTEKDTLAAELASLKSEFESHKAESNKVLEANKELVSKLEAAVKSLKDIETEQLGKDRYEALSKLDAVASLGTQEEATKVLVAMSQESFDVLEKVAKANYVNKPKNKEEDNGIDGKNEVEKSIASAKKDQEVDLTKAASDDAVATTQKALANFANWAINRNKNRKMSNDKK